MNQHKCLVEKRLDDSGRTREQLLCHMGAASLPLARQVKHSSPSLQGCVALEAAEAPDLIEAWYCHN